MGKTNNLTQSTTLAAETKPREKAKYFDLPNGALLEIPGGFIDDATFNCTKGLKDNGKIISLENYKGGPATKEHLLVIFDFYSAARENGVDKNSKAVKIPEWAASIFKPVGKEKLIETTNLASFLNSKEFLEYSLSYMSSMLHSMATIDEMRAYLCEDNDFKADEFDMLAREKNWRQNLLKWGLVSENKVKQLVEKAEEQEAQEDAME